MLDANLKAQLAAYLERITQPVEITALLDETRCLARNAGAAARHRRGLAAGARQRDPQAGGPHRTPSFAINRPGESHGPRFAGLPMGHEFTSLVLALLQVGGYPPKVEQDVLEQIRAIDTRPGVRGLRLADLPQLPRRGAGAQPDGGAEPAHQGHDDRGQPVPGRDRAAPGHGRAHRVPERHDVRHRPHEPGGDPGQGRHQRRRAGGEENRGQGPVRRADRRRRSGRRGGGRVCGAQGHSHRHRVRALRRPGAGHAGHRELRVGQGNRRAEVRAGAGGTRAPLRRRHHEPAARQGAQAGARADRSGTGERRLAQGTQRDPDHRRALAPAGRAGRAAVPQQGRGLLPALRRSAVQGQARGGRSAAATPASRRPSTWPASSATSR